MEAATGEPLGEAALGADADIDAAVRSARTAFDEGPWSRTTVAERVEFMLKFADALDARADATSKLVSQENGMPITLSSAFNGAAPAGLLRMYAQVIQGVELEVPRPSAQGATIVRREPVGVVGAITPWNYPQALAMFKLAPALATGCTVVLKPSPETALDTYIFADVAQEIGLPPGVLNIVLAGREAGASLVTHPGVDKIAFTGSTRAGREIGAECGRLIRRCTLELGGKSAAVFLDDGVVDTFLAGLPNASFMNNSQTCTTQSRILAPRSRYDEVVDAVATFSQGLQVGNPLDPATTCGPMASAQHLERVLGYIDIGRNSNARLVTGGGRPSDQDRGWFVEPTVLSVARARSTAWCTTAATEPTTTGSPASATPAGAGTRCFRLSWRSRTISSVPAGPAAPAVRCTCRPPRAVTRCSTTSSRLAPSWAGNGWAT